MDYLGTVHSRVEVTIQAQVQGKVGRKAIDEGQTARQGEVIAEIYSPESSARLEKVSAEVERARAERDFACTVHASDLRLARADAVPRRQAETSGKNCSVAKAAVSAAEAAQRELDSMLAKTMESAPFNGMALRWLSETGQNVMPGQPLLIFGNEELEVRVQVSETDVARGIKPGTPVSVRFSGREESRLSVASVAPLAVGPGRSVEVKISIPPEMAGDLFHGMSLEVSFALQEADEAVTVPKRALRKSGPDHFIFIIEKDRARRVKVEPVFSDSGRVLVRPEPPEGALLVVSGLEALTDGMDVFVVMEEERP